MCKRGLGLTGHAGAGRSWAQAKGVQRTEGRGQGKGGTENSGKN